MVDWKKFFSSFFQAVPWLKNIRMMLGIVIIGFIALTIYRAYFMPRNIQQQKPQINVQPGGVGNFNFSQKQGTERRWFIGPTVIVSKNKDWYIGGTILRSF